MKIRAVRGATTVEADDREAILEATGELLTEIMSQNKIKPGELVSAFFTVTPDLTRAFPAEAARRLGLTELPALGAVEAAVPGAPEFCIRVLLHFYTSHAQEEIKHVYLRRAKVLRPDRVREKD